MPVRAPVSVGLPPDAAAVVSADCLPILKEKNKLILIASHVMSDLDELATHIVYLQDGKLQFFDTIDFLKNQTGEDRLGKAIAWLMKHGFNKRDEVEVH